MRRRAFLTNATVLSGAVLLLPRLRSLPGLAPSAQPFAGFKLGAISDGFSADFEEALQIMKGYGLGWVEIRAVWGKYNTEASADEIRRIRQLLDQYSFKCSVVDSALYKCTLPGTDPIHKQADPYPYSGQIELLKRASERAHAWGTDKVRGFTFWRVAQPPALYARIAEDLAKAADAARAEGIRLVIEDEESCNGGTGHETAAILKLAPAPNLGFNWDVGNGYTHGEVSYPDGYQTLDKSRIWHLHLKGMTCGAGLKNCRETFAGEGEIDLAGQFRALQRDHYQESMSLECEFEAPGLTHQQTSRRSLEGLLRVLNQVAS
ncbi:MAG TPA: sugar phosphate isomerase/epimerase family protein [Terriglobia bacterium]|jgi:sugar phosphate isomerase/epimerase|nr:sugar phosphate isomerase/epimerase family protein [Terriglobia bacterium]